MSCVSAVSPRSEETTHFFKKKKWGEDGKEAIERPSGWGYLTYKGVEQRQVGGKPLM